jgi:hypothetical protein
MYNNILQRSKDAINNNSPRITTGGPLLVPTNLTPQPYPPKLKHKQEDIMSMDMGASLMALSGLLGGSAQDDDGDNDVSFAPAQPTKCNFLFSFLPSTHAQNRFFSPHTGNETTLHLRSRYVQSNAGD